MSPRKDFNRSAVTNGKRPFLRRIAGGATEASRRYADILAALFVERGGVEAMTVAVQEACRSYCGLAVRMEELHADLVAGKPVANSTLCRVSNSLTRARCAMGEPPTKRAAAKPQALAVPAPGSGTPAPLVHRIERNASL
ncbi:hypothetical protein ASF57_23040 [Methylobacterium sp. Leaf117]|nr:hypothetical protein ASF57_23040 [Methylobacterium sp. Leaf117]